MDKKEEKTPEKSEDELPRVSPSEQEGLKHPGRRRCGSSTYKICMETAFDFTTAGDWDCVAAVERLPALHYSVDFIFLSFGIMGFIVEV